MNTQEMGELMTIFERFVKLFGNSTGAVVHEGEHFRLTEVPPKRLPPVVKKARTRRGKAKLPYGKGKAVMNVAIDPTVWPYENGRGVGPKHLRSKAVQRATKKILTGSEPVMREELFKQVKVRISSALRKEVDSKGRYAWEMTLGTLDRKRIP
jgi:hypothetical protein